MRIVPVAYLTSYTLSLLGNAVAAIALPLIVLQVTGSALGAGVLAAATAVPAVAAGLLMGVVIDRINRRTSSIVTDLVSAAAIAALPVVDAVTGLGLGWFVLFGIIGSLGDVPGMTAREALLPAVARHGGVTVQRLVGLRESLGAIALLVGPAAAGLLMVAFDGSTVLWITAATSAAAALLTLLVPHRVGALDPAPGAVPGSALDAAPDTGATAGAPAGNGWTQLRDGWRVLSGDRFLATTTALGVVTAAVLASMQGLVLPVHVTLLDRPGLLGFVLAALAAGLLAGSAVYAVAGARGRRRAWLVTGLVASAVGFAVLGTLPAVWLLLAGAFVVGAASGLSGGLLGVLTIERAPERMRGRITGAQNALMTAAPPVGIVGAAVLTERASVEVAALVLAAVWVAAAIAGLAAPSLRDLDPAAGIAAATAANGAAAPVAGAAPAAGADAVATAGEAVARAQR